MTPRVQTEAGGGVGGEGLTETFVANHQTLRGKSLMPQGFSLGHPNLWEEGVGLVSDTVSPKRGVGGWSCVALGGAWGLGWVSCLVSSTLHIPKVPRASMAGRG